MFDYEPDDLLRLDPQSGQCLYPGEEPETQSSGETVDAQCEVEETRSSHHAEIDPDPVFLRLPMCDPSIPVFLLPIDYTPSMRLASFGSVPFPSLVKNGPFETVCHSQRATSVIAENLWRYLTQLQATMIERCASRYAMMNANASRELLWEQVQRSDITLWARVLYACVAFAEQLVPADDVRLVRSRVWLVLGRHSDALGCRNAVEI